MANINGNLLVGELTELTERTYEGRTSRSFKVLVEYQDGQRIAHPIYWPDGYQPDRLELNRLYAFPVEARAKRDGKGITYTARLDLQPFEPPTTA